MPGHSLYSPSSSATWLECSYSARYAVPEPLKPASTVAAADEGTRRHASLDGYVYFGELPPEDAPEYDQIALAAAFLRQLEPGELHSELTMELTPECGGTTDVLNVHPYIATVFDAKFGKWDVDAQENTQMLSYAVMAVAKFMEELRNTQWFRLVIFQPNGLEEKPFKQWIAHRSEVEAHRLRMLRAIADRSPPRPGPWCRWCKAFQQCPAMASDAGFVIGAISRPIEQLTTEELVRLLRLIRALGDVKPAYEDALTTHLKMGRTADGALLKPGRTFRAWNDPVQAAAILYQHYGAKGVQPPTPAQAEKLGLEGKKYAAVGAHKPEGKLKASY